jgi:O-methyltransferase
MMDFFSKFYNVYAKVTPKFLQAMIRPFWRIFFMLPQRLANSKLCAKMDVGWKRSDFVYKTFDYVRHSSLELVAREIYENNIRGNVAELGVYQGDFAKCINQIFPDKKLYLFDTFEGFTENDLQIEKSNALYHPEFDFKNTSISSVLNKMKHKENCIVKKGYFPGTANGVDDTFSFVNIDVDLSEPIYNGLCWFYPRLEKGGYIFVHDYNHRQWTGAKAGVKKFTKEYGVPYFPLSDEAGSVVFMK